MNLAEMFINNKGQPVTLNGNQIVMSHRVDVVKNQEATIEIISCNNEYRQGIELSIDKRKGFIEVNNQKLTAPVFWLDTAPKIFTFKCYPVKNMGKMNIWNIWQFSKQEDRVDAWIGNSGIQVKQEDEKTLVFHCSNGVGDIDFNDLVFKLTLQ